MSTLHFVPSNLHRHTKQGILVNRHMHQNSIICVQLILSVMRPVLLDNTSQMWQHIIAKRNKYAVT